MGTDIERTLRTPAEARLAADERRFNVLWRKAQVYARSSLVPKVLKNNVDDTFLVLNYGAELGLKETKALEHCPVIEGKVSESAQLAVALAERAGHKIVTVESTDERCTVKGLRYGAGAEEWQSVTWTLDTAKRAGLLDIWAERWVANEGSKGKHPERYTIGDLVDGIDSTKVEKAPEWARTLVDKGETKHKENWARYPVDLLWCRAAKSLCRKAFGDALLGLDDGPPVEEFLPIGDYEQRPVERDDEPIDAEIIENEAAKTGEGADGAADEAMPDATGPSGEVQGQTIPAGTAPEPTPPAEGPGSTEGQPAVAGPSAPAPSSAQEKSRYAEAVHLLRVELALSDEALDEILHDVTGDVSANSVTRDNASEVVRRMREAAGKAA